MPIIVILFSFNYNRNVKIVTVHQTDMLLLKITFYRTGNL